MEKILKLLQHLKVEYNPETNIAKIDFFGIDEIVVKCKGKDYYKDILKALLKYLKSNKTAKELLEINGWEIDIKAKDIV